MDNNLDENVVHKEQSNNQDKQKEEGELAENPKKRSESNDSKMT